jgi:hypothetical protein
LYANWVRAGRKDPPSPGLLGETGKPASGVEWYARANEKQEIKRDLDKGKVPFYVYEYDTGRVKHNNTLVWLGATLTETLELILKEYPHQRGITDIP